MVIHSNFRLLPGAAKDGLEDAVEAWKDEGEEQSKNAMTKQESKRGYDFNSYYDAIRAERRGQLSAAFGVDDWRWHFFEMGTVFIPPTPVVRPSKSKADRKFKSVAGTSVARALARKAVR
jgi:HK97 gp10 family phage protein